MTNFLSLLALATLIPFARTSDRETFFKDLILKYRLPQSEAAIWNCLADHHSGFQTGLRLREPASQETNYGVFQINGDIWCSDGRNLCNLDCSKLLDDDLTDDILCAREIWRKQGLEAWEAWERRCQNRLDEYMPTYKNEERCQMAREFHFQGVPNSMLATVLCIAEEESGFVANSQGGPFPEGFHSHGLFRISGQWWCNEGRPGAKQLCEIPCSRLLDNHVADDLRCVMTIFNETASYREDKDGFFAWDSYARKCKDPTRNQERIRDCFTATEFQQIFGQRRVQVAPTRAPSAISATTPRLPPWITIRAVTRPLLPPTTTTPRPFGSFRTSLSNPGAAFQGSGFRGTPQSSSFVAQGTSGGGSQGFRAPGSQGFATREGPTVPEQPGFAFNGGFRTPDSSGGFRTPPTSSGGFRTQGSQGSGFRGGSLTTPRTGIYIPNPLQDLEGGQKRIRKCWSKHYTSQKVVALEYEEDCYKE